MQELGAELEQTRRNATAAQAAAAARDAELSTQLTAAVAERDTALQHAGRDHLRGHGVVLDS